jgi:hypothetical protein
MRVCVCRRCSSAARIAPMRPSIMSDGRDDVGPAARVRQRLSHQARPCRRSIDVAGIDRSAVLAVRRERIERDVGDHAELRQVACLSARTARCARPSGSRLARIQALGLGRRDREQRQRRDAAARAPARPRAAARRSTARSTPGIDATASRRPALRARTPARSDLRRSAQFRASARARIRRGACGAGGSGGRAFGSPRSVQSATLYAQTPPGLAPGGGLQCGVVLL